MASLLYLDLIDGENNAVGQIRVETDRNDWILWDCEQWSFSFASADTVKVDGHLLRVIDGGQISVRTSAPLTIKRAFLKFSET